MPLKSNSPNFRPSLPSFDKKKRSSGHVPESIHPSQPESHGQSESALSSPWNGSREQQHTPVSQWILRNGVSESLLKFAEVQFTVWTVIPGPTVQGPPAHDISKVGSAYSAYEFLTCIFCIFVAYFAYFGTNFKCFLILQVTAWSFPSPPGRVPGRRGGWQDISGNAQ